MGSFQGSSGALLAERADITYGPVSPSQVWESWLESKKDRREASTLLCTVM